MDHPELAEASGILFVLRRQSNGGILSCAAGSQEHIDLEDTDVQERAARAFPKILADTGSVTAALALTNPEKEVSRHLYLNISSAWIRNLVGIRDHTAALQRGDRGRPRITV